MPLSWKKSWNGRRSPATTKKTNKKHLISKNDRGGGSATSTASVYCSALPFIKIITQCPVKLLLDGLAPFPVSVQHGNKFFLGAFVVLKGVGCFAAHWVNNVCVFVLIFWPNIFSHALLLLYGKCQLHIGSPFHFECCFSSVRWHFGKAPGGHKLLIIRPPGTCPKSQKSLGISDVMALIKPFYQALVHKGLNIIFGKSLCFQLGGCPLVAL